MKKVIICMLFCSMLLTSCNHVSEETTAAQTTNSETILDDMETTMSPEIVLEQLERTQWLMIQLVSGESVAPYQSLVYANVDGGTCADGTLLFSSFPEALADWLQKDLIPMVELSEEARLWDTEKEEEARKDFAFYRKNEDGFAEVGVLNDATLADVYRYGDENFVGERIYVRLWDSREVPQGDASYENIFGVEFPLKKQKAPIFDYTPLVVSADGRKIAPYASSIYFFWDGRISDGPLMFIRMEEKLPDWIEQGMIPSITLNENSSVQFICGENSTITHSGRFRIFVQNDDGTVTNVHEIENATLTDVYAYGKANLEGKTVFISYGCMIYDANNKDDRNDVSCIFCTSF